MADPMQTHGMFSWSELYAGNGEAMKRFYSAVLGWTYDDMPVPHGAYPVIKAGEAGRPARVAVGAPMAPTGNPGRDRGGGRDPAAARALRASTAPPLHGRVAPRADPVATGEHHGAGFDHWRPRRRCSRGGYHRH